MYSIYGIAIFARCFLVKIEKHDTRLKLWIVDKSNRSSRDLNQ